MNRTILVVDDDEELRETMCESLIEEGFAAVCAANGRQALDYLRSGESPCVIFLDLMMPVMNGWQFREAQKSDQALAKIPVVILTAGRTEQNPTDANRVMFKPVRLDELLEAAQQFCPC